MAKKSGSKPLTKTEILRNISESTGLAKKDVVLVLDHLTNEIQKSLKGSGSAARCLPVPPRRVSRTPSPGNCRTVRPSPPASRCVSAL